MAYDQVVVKMYLGINDRNSDTVLDRFGTEANEAVDNFLTNLVGGQDVNTVHISDQIDDLANFIVLQKFQLKVQNFDAADRWQKQIDRIKESVKQRIQGISYGTSKIGRSPHW